MRTYKLYTDNTTGDNSAYVTVQKSGRIKSIRWAISLDSAVDSNAYRVELSTSPVSEMTSNDTQRAIDQVNTWNNVGAAGTAWTGINIQRLMDYPIVAGERLYLNISGSCNASYTTCFVDLQD